MPITYYTLTEAAALIGVSVGTLKRAAWRRTLKGARKCVLGRRDERWEVPGSTVSALERLEYRDCLAVLHNRVRPS